MLMYYVYIIENKKNQYYIGYSNDFLRRLEQHRKNKDASYKVIYYEAYSDEKSARERERKLKYYGSAWRGLKQRLGLRGRGADSVDKFSSSIDSKIYT
ncbi:MAG: hypothetical protein G01um10143_198 [Parcubacteria group bacterium Gr01-1014_3]|nr:MAG: hypothetical protein G01um10143_198 [Parcubacteria group bacterium Gr01-1014_3]